MFADNCVSKRCFFVSLVFVCAVNKLRSSILPPSVRIESWTEPLLLALKASIFDSFSDLIKTNYCKHL